MSIAATARLALGRDQSGRRQGGRSQGDSSPGHDAIDERDHAGDGGNECDEGPEPHCGRLPRLWPASALGRELVRGLGSQGAVGATDARHASEEVVVLDGAPTKRTHENDIQRSLGVFPAAAHQSDGDLHLPILDGY
jgi:hypothetical protein